MNDSAETSISLIQYCRLDLEALALRLASNDCWTLSAAGVKTQNLSLD
ncbi:hypothetical protein [Nitrosomonas sp.]|nr:hypothetical protein [Nitrosomonas sp.]MCB1949861.1 hypothetical protein [Nitrosomonas sp.]